VQSTSETVQSSSETDRVATKPLSLFVIGADTGSGICGRSTNHDVTYNRKGNRRDTGCLAC